MALFEYLYHFCRENGWHVYDVGNTYTLYQINKMYSQSHSLKNMDLRDFCISSRMSSPYVKGVDFEKYIKGLEPKNR